MTPKEDFELRKAVELALIRAASVGVDATGLTGKSLTALLQLFKAIDDCMDAYGRMKRDLSKYRVNPTNLEQFGIPRSTVNCNDVFRRLVRHYGEAQEEALITVKRSSYESLCSDLEQMRVYEKSAVELGLENQDLKKENERLNRELELTREAYTNAVTGRDVRYDFNNILKNKKKPNK